MKFAPWTRPAWPPRWTRRTWLRASAALSLFTLAARGARAGSVRHGQGRQTLPPATLAAFLDTLLPADELTPAASALGVPARILADVMGDADYRRLVEAGCRWLDAAAGGDFGLLPPALREQVVAVLEQLDWNSPPRRFMHVVRDQALGYYYTDPRAWGGLPVRRPPQPYGYPESVDPQ